MIEQFIGLVKSTTKWAGCFNRRQYVTVFVGMTLIGIVIGLLLMGVMQVMVESGGLAELLALMLLLAWYVACTIVGVGAGVRRFHDLDLSGWHVLLFLIPVVSFLTFFYLVFGSGKEVGETRWG